MIIKIHTSPLFPVFVGGVVGRPNGSEHDKLTARPEVIQNHANNLDELYYYFLDSFSCCHNRGDSYIVFFITSIHFHSLRFLWRLFVVAPRRSSFQAVVLLRKRLDCSILSSLVSHEYIEQEEKALDRLLEGKKGNLMAGGRNATLTWNSRINASSSSTAIRSVRPNPRLNDFILQSPWFPSAPRILILLLFTFVINSSGGPARKINWNLKGTPGSKSKGC